MEPQLVNCCRLEQTGTKEFGKTMKNPNLRKEESQPKKAKNWRIERVKKRISRKDHQRLLNNFEMEGLMAQRGLWNLAKEKIMNERGELPMYEGDFWSSWPREDERG